MMAMESLLPAIFMNELESIKKCFTAEARRRGVSILDKNNKNDSPQRRGNAEEIFSIQNQPSLLRASASLR
jgi:hypothetical protein